MSQGPIYQSVYQGTSPWSVTGVVSTSGTVSCSVNNAITGVVSVSGTASVTQNTTPWVVQDKNVATSNSAVPLFVGLVGGSDGTNVIPVLPISTATIASANTQTRGVMTAGPLIQWVRTGSAAANAKLSVTRTAITGAYNVLVGYAIGMACGTASSTLDNISITHGAVGTASVFFQLPGRCPGSDSRWFAQDTLAMAASLFTAINIEAQASAPASGFQFGTIWGYTLPS